ncbi:DNA_pol_B_2 domain-containing protein [Trichonephila clavata]|uniref:DNA_pol_B_2 domain-containing protein n=1 Tax=Trichonephila clavata TaxID=2740835 RepID=A0A8X6M500_TRICU|nr:DNA_pol_B_2 domain-containing protein [Trichonephila clavata]
MEHYKDECAKDNFDTNVYIATFTTSSARIRLYEIMDKLGDKDLYSDTDSIMYIDDGTNTIETGCMLGEWTDELEKDQYIQNWISPASKDYACRLNNGEGFKMSYESETKLDFEERMKIITAETESSALTHYVNSCLNISNFDDLCNILIENFLKPNIVNLSDFSQHQLRNNLDEYFHQKLNCGRQLGLSPQLILEGLTDGMPTNIKQLMTINLPTSPTEWLKVATRLMKTQAAKPEPIKEFEAELSNFDLNVDRLSELVETLSIKFESLTLVDQ